MQGQKGKKKKIGMLLAICAVCIVCIMAVVICRNEKETSGYGEVRMSDDFVVRYQYENVDEEGVLFSYYRLIEIEMQVGLWYKEGYTPGKENPYIEINWENEKGLWKKKVKKFYLDEPYYREGVYDEGQGEPELEPVTIRFYMNKHTIPEEGGFGVRFIVDTKPYEITFDKEAPPDIMYLLYKKQEDGILVYTEKKQAPPEEEEQERDTKNVVIRMEPEDWLYFKVYERFWEKYPFVPEVIKGRGSIKIPICCGISHANQQQRGDYSGA